MAGTAVTRFREDATRLAQSAGTVKAQNTVVLGAAAPLLPLSAQDIEVQLQALFAPKGDRIVQANLHAFRMGCSASALRASASWRSALSSSRC